MPDSQGPLHASYVDPSSRLSINSSVLSSSRLSCSRWLGRVLTTGPPPLLGPSPSSPPPPLYSLLSAFSSHRYRQMGHCMLSSCAPFPGGTSALDITFPNLPCSLSGPPDFTPSRSPPATLSRATDSLGRITRSRSNTSSQSAHIVPLLSVPSLRPLPSVAISWRALSSRSCDELAALQSLSGSAALHPCSVPLPASLGYSVVSEVVSPSLHFDPSSIYSDLRHFGRVACHFSSVISLPGSSCSLSPLPYSSRSLPAVDLFSSHCSVKYLSDLR
uniref:Uncharacterized protein n=1 Tax=Knipowitschia caucasica TaxID=637954 RepID=A0AAV2J714_KNICA